MKYYVGDIIQYNSYGEIREVLVLKKYKDVKNGEPGFEGTLLTYNGNYPKSGGYDVWGYDHQITALVNPSASRKAGELYELCKQFIHDNDISCAETICQKDSVIENSYDLLHKICDIIGYEESK